MVCGLVWLGFFLFGERADREDVDNRDELAELATEDCGEDAQGQDDEEHGDREWCREDDAVVFQVHGDVADEERVHEVGEVGVLAQDVQQGIEGLRIFLVGEDREEEERGAEGVEDTFRRELVRRVDGFERRVAFFKEQVVVVPEQGAE